MQDGQPAGATDPSPEGKPTAGSDGGIGRLKVLILSWERPSYLWASLDSIYRNTRSDVDFILIDNNSQDPQVARIIKGFDRRGMFSEIFWSPTNDPLVIEKTLRRISPALGRYFAFVESDVIIEQSPRCWVETMLEIMERNPKLAMLGSQIDKSDFVDPEKVSAELGQPIDGKLENILKARSPERRSYVGPGTLGSPHSPAGRLQMLRSEAVAEVGFDADYALYRKLKDKGYDTLITGDVVHRHLSLLNYYDYPDYDMESRDTFMSTLSRKR